MIEQDAVRIDIASAPTFSAGEPDVSSIVIEGCEGRRDTELSRIEVAMGALEVTIHRKCEGSRAKAEHLHKSCDFRMQANASPMGCPP